MRLPAAAVVLCGGRSERMGRDKALLDWGGKPLVAHVASRLSPAFEEVVLSGDPSRYGRLGWRCIADRGGAGPLAGLCAAFLALPHAALFLVACDMPRIDAASAVALWPHLRSRDAAVPLAAHGPEPLHAFYARRVLPAAARLLAGSGRINGLAGECDVARVPVERLPGRGRTLEDCDTAGDFGRLRRLENPGRNLPAARCGGDR
ncbi:MAG: molybdenum cofactor guanylyltransferase [Planctomycetia bacterium]|nr:molybdenum cofactor guanylyltransferase [Planctomycetia bacterium]